MSLRLAALDLSLTGTGIAWTHDHKSKPNVGCRTVHTGTKRGHQRVDAILRDIAAACRMQPHLVVIEGPSYGSNGSAVEQLAGLRGVVKHWLWSPPEVPYIEVAPGTLKVWATGDGAADKTAVSEAVIATYGRLCHIEDDNSADAMALLSLAAHAYSEPLAPVLDPRKLRAANVVKWPDLAATSPTR